MLMSFLEILHNKQYSLYGATELLEVLEHKTRKIR